MVWIFMLQDGEELVSSEKHLEFCNVPTTAHRLETLIDAVIRQFWATYTSFKYFMGLIDFMSSKWTISILGRVSAKMPSTGIK